MQRKQVIIETIGPYLL